MQQLHNTMTQLDEGENLLAITKQDEQVKCSKKCNMC